MLVCLMVNSPPNYHACILSIITILQSASSMELINKATPWEFNGGLMITILKTARIVRFVRSQAVSKTISRFNWYWPLQRLNACLAYIDCCSRRNYYHEDDDMSINGDKNINGGPMNGGPMNGGQGGNLMNYPGGMGSNNHRGDPMGQSSKRSNSTSTVGRGVEEYQSNRQSSFRRLGGQEDDIGARKGGLLGGMVWLLRSVGIMSQDKTAEKRDIAARKIQRSWRRAMARQREEEENNDLFGDELGVLDEMAATDDGGGSTWKAGSIKNKNGSKNKKKLPKKLRKMSMYPGVEASKISARISQKLKYAAGGGSAAESQVGGAMRELTGQRVAIGIIVALLLTATFTYVEQDATRPATMVILHAQTTGTRVSPDGTTTITRPPPERWTNMALTAARSSSIPDLYRFDLANGSNRSFSVSENDDEELRDRERLQIVIESTNHTSPDGITMKSVGWFAYRQERRNEALVQLFSTIFILLLWLFGVTAFAGPVMVLVVLPIERMVRLLGMLMVDPLGYQSTSRYRRFVAEEDELTVNTRWTKEVLKGMETSFLMSTILRIGSLMQVGFGSAGVEIIRKNLEKKQGGNLSLLTSKGITVSCIFLFCDIRQFTDATECLQEEVFVFTNRIAAVVHSFCHSYGGSANKNVGDAFLCSWLLDAPPNDADSGFGGGEQLYAKNNQADKCLLCVVKIIMALHHDSYYIETMSEAPRQRLLAKLKKRPGPVVQMGCGVHAGKAVQGAIGSERKIDATYVSEAVEMSETLESSTKKYGLKMLMSNSFHTLLHPNNRQRCRLVDQIVIPNDEKEDEDDLTIMYERDDIIELYTYDMDVDALWTAPPVVNKSATDRGTLDNTSMSDIDSRQGHSDRRNDMKKGTSGRVPGSTRLGRTGRRMSISGMLASKSTITSSTTSGPNVKGPLDGSTHDLGGTEHNSAAMKTNAAGSANAEPKDAPDTSFRAPELILPTGPALYNPAIWRSEQMFRIRKKYLDGLFFHNYSQGLQSFYHRDWDRATQSFQAILATFEDGPSRYFLNQIEKHDGKPWPNFRPYGIA